MRTYAAIVASFALALLVQPVAAQGTADRLYVIECGERTAPDVAPWTPGVNVGKPIDFVDTCYLIKHGNDWMVWDTGLPDAIFATPSADPNAWRRTGTLAGALEKVGVKPADIKYVAVSHSHPDHIGNVELFPQAVLLVQKAEYDWPNQDGSPRFKASHPVNKLDGDFNVFGDGSVTILSTPGHTAGHQSLLVKLPETGAVLLSGDAVHLKDNWDAKRVPAINFDKTASVASMQRMAETIAQNKAQLWINHDKPQSATMRHAPAFYP
ncbi:MAG: N-acyl homoserine lactonase family protein [Betaproteobacteria bacterium]